MPRDLDHYYQVDYYGIPTSLDELALKAEDERWKIDIVRRFVPSGRLLELGPSYGKFAYAAKQAGFDVDTMERDAACCRFLTDVAGVRAIHTDDVADLSLARPPYDVVALWQVLEHLPEPRKTFEAAARILAPGGVLVVAAPNPRSLQFRLLWRYWAHIDAPRHLRLMPIPLLMEWARPLGLEPVLVTTNDAGTLLNNKFGWQKSLGNFCRHSLTLRLMHKIGAGLNRALAPIERSGLRGSTYTVVFRQKSVS